MSLDSRHRPVRPSPLFHFVTPPRTPENRKYHGTFPNPELSSRRRLFPRRTVLPVLTIPDTDPKPTFSPFEVYSAPSRRFADVDDQLVDNGSSCSSGSMKILRLSTLDLWSEDTIFDLEDSPSKGVLSSRPRHVGAAALREKTPLDKLPDFGGSMLEDYLCELDDNGVDPPKVDDQASVATESTPVAGSETRLNDSIHRVKSWDSAITVCTTASISEDGRVSVRHHVDMTVIVPKVYIPEERVRLSIMVSKGLQASQVRNLEPGLSSLFFEEAVPNPENQEIIVDRDICDLELPLKLYLTFSYPLQRHHYVVATVPTFRPHQGKTLSEKVFIDKPSRPLIIKPLARNHLSSWKSKSSPGSHVTRFERVPMPRLYPEEFKDDIRIKIMDPSPVCFESLSDLDPCELVWNLDIAVEEVLGARLECDLSFNLEVGKRNPVVALDAHGWRPKYFAIDGRLVTEQAGAWRENEKGYVAFYKREAMAHGPIRVETHWQEPKKENFNSASKADIPLPRVTDFRVVGGRLTCKVDKRLLLLGRSGASSGSYAFLDGPQIRLPDLDPGYTLYLTPESGGSHRPLDTLPEEHETVECPGAGPSTKSETSYDADGETSPTIADDDNDDDEDSSRKLYSNPFTTCFFPLWLIVGLLMYVGPVLRNGPNTNCTISGYCGPDSMERLAGWQQMPNNSSVIIALREVDEATIVFDGDTEEEENMDMQHESKSERAAWESPCQKTILKSRREGKRGCLKVEVVPNYRC